MESKKIRDWLEIVATLSVLAGLLLVAQEIRVNTRANALQTAVDTSAALTEPFFQSKELKSASEKIHRLDGAYAPEVALIERYDLSPEEAIVWSRHLLQIWIQVEAMYKYQDEALAVRYARTLLRAPDNRAFVESYQFFDPEFNQLLSGLLADLENSRASE